MPDQHDPTPEAPMQRPDTVDDDAQVLDEALEDEDGMLEAPVRPRELTPHDTAALARIGAVAREAAGVALDLKGEDIRILTMNDVVTYTDFLVLGTGRSTRQTRRIAEEIGVRLRRLTG